MYLPDTLFTPQPAKVKKATPRKFLIFRKMKLSSSSTFENFLNFLKRKPLLYFRKRKSRKNFLYFLKRKLFFYFGKWNYCQTSKMGRFAKILRKIKTVPSRISSSFWIIRYFVNMIQYEDRRYEVWILNFYKNQVQSSNLQFSF